MAARSLAIIVAVKDAEANLAAILRRLAPKEHLEVEFIFCVAGSDAPAPPTPSPNVRVVFAAPESLVPHLWRDGILLARADSVALTTAHCIPAPEWVERLLQADTGRWPGIGGIIDNDPAASAANWAVFFLRYLAFAPPRKAGIVGDLAADNAVYRRAAILAHPDLLAIGFWEPSFHHRFQAAGEALYLEPSIAVIHHGLGSPWRFVGHRYAHGREYGLARASAQLLATRFLLLAASPIVPLLTMARIFRRIFARSRYARHLLRSLPWLCLFVMAWAAGEARGYASGIAAGFRRVGGEDANER